MCSISTRSANLVHASGGTSASTSAMDGCTNRILRSRAWEAPGHRCTALRRILVGGEQGWREELVLFLREVALLNPDPAAPNTDAATSEPSARRVFSTNLLDSVCDLAVS